MEPDILYEDTDCLAISKPAGLVVHGDGRSTMFTTGRSTMLTGRSEEPTLVDWILSKYPKIKNVGEPWQNGKGEKIYRPGIVHRLDRETSGVMLVAKTQKGFESLKKQFQEHKIQKTYQAFVYGDLKESGIIDRPIGRSAKDFRQWSAQRGARGEMREAITEYSTIFHSKDYSFVYIFPKTGRTHQIRVHFKAINYPLVGDSLYAPKRENTLGFKRLALHSYEVVFLNTKGGEVRVTAPEPSDFTKALKKMKILQKE